MDYMDYFKLQDAKNNKILDQETLDAMSSIRETIGDSHGELFNMDDDALDEASIGDKCFWYIVHHNELHQAMELRSVWSSKVNEVLAGHEFLRYQGNGIPIFNMGE